MIDGSFMHCICSIRKDVLRNFEKFTGKRLCQSLFLHFLLFYTELILEQCSFSVLHEDIRKPEICRYFQILLEKIGQKWVTNVRMEV